jgi:hypothetical protein
VGGNCGSTVGYAAVVAHPVRWWGDRTTIAVILDQIGDTNATDEDARMSDREETERMIEPVDSFDSVPGPSNRLVP